MPRYLMPKTAFSLDNRSSDAGKKPSVKLDEHRAWLKTLPCLVTGREGVDPAHVSYRDARFAKPGRGLGEKVDDNWCVPLCRAEHDKQEFYPGGERAYWDAVGIDPVLVAAALFIHSGDDAAGQIVISQARG